MDEESTINQEVEKRNMKSGKCNFRPTPKSAYKRKIEDIEDETYTCSYPSDAAKFE